MYYLATGVHLAYIEIHKGHGTARTDGTTSLPSTFCREKSSKLEFSLQISNERRITYTAREILFMFKIVIVEES